LYPANHPDGHGVTWHSTSDFVNNAPMNRTVSRYAKRATRKFCQWIETGSCPEWIKKNRLYQATKQQFLRNPAHEITAHKLLYFDNSPVRPQHELIGTDLYLYDYIGRTENMAEVFTWLRTVTGDPIEQVRRNHKTLPLLLSRKQKRSNLFFLPKGF